MEKIKERKHYTKEEITKCGWVLQTASGEYEIYVQKGEDLYFVPATGLVIGVFQRKKRL
jgi:hypothetical protein